MDSARELAAHLSESGHVPVLSLDDSAVAGLGPHGVAVSDIGVPDLAVALGGDGTILKAVHLLGPVETPLLGVNLGRLGFLCAPEGGDVIGVVDRALAGEGTVEKRCTLRAEIVVGGRDAGSHRALNEVFVGRAAGGRAVEVAVAVNGTPVQCAVCDGAMVATPTGSTAYALSCGGPIVSPQVRGSVLVIVGPHTLASRPIVLAEGDRVTLTFPEPSRSGGCVAMDGEVAPVRGPLERVEVALGPSDVHLLRLDGDDFYGAVRAAFFEG